MGMVGWHGRVSEAGGILGANLRKDSIMTTQLTTIDPPQLYRSPAFAQGMVIPAGPTLYVGGQNGIDATGALLEGYEAQTAQAMRNLLAVLAEAGAGPEHVAKLTIYLAPGLDPAVGFAAVGPVWGAHRTAVSVVAVAPARPGAFVEIEAVAMIPQ